MDKHIHTPITEEITADLKAGDYVYITGTLYVARDAAHKRMMEVLDEGKELPINIKDCSKNINALNKKYDQIILYKKKQKH